MASSAVEPIAGTLHGPLPTHCPGCNLAWWVHWPAQISGSNHVRCVECKRVYATTPAEKDPTP